MQKKRLPNLAALLALCLAAGAAHAANTEANVDGVISLSRALPHSVDDRLVVTVLELKRKRRVPDRQEILVITLRVATPEQQEEIHFSSDDGSYTWRGYEFHYVDGSPDEVKLIINATAEKQ